MADGRQAAPGAAIEGGLRLGAIPEGAYSDYRYEVIFKAYKWDPQVEDHNTVSRHVVLLERKTAGQLVALAEGLAAETAAIEEALMHRSELVRQLGLPARIRWALNNMEGYDPARHVRLMRFDFHPTSDGWAVSEVNSDVPGGFAEASVLPGIAQPYFPGYGPGPNMGGHMLKAFAPLLSAGGRIAFVHATSYSDDRQVMQFLGDAFQAQGYRTLYAGPDLVEWKNRRAYSLMGEQAEKLDGIVRFFPLEWLANLPRRTGWQGYYDGETPACNHPVSMLAQSKRLPLVWDRLGIEIPLWRQLLPETREPKSIDPGDEGWVFKPALGRVGEGISIREALAAGEMERIRKTARRNAGEWVAQRRFESRPLAAGDGTPYHLCMGVFTVNGRCAGYYGRVSPYPRIDARAKDIPVLVAERGNEP